ncbi:hypothetical protein A2U01_0051799, partial [Trifolium medium]|nr:hypothetical protein [Trifolium medium]
AELDAIIHEEAEGQRTASLVARMLEIRQLIQTLMVSGDIPLGSRPYLTLQQVERNAHIYYYYRSRRDRGGLSTQ